MSILALMDSPQVRVARRLFAGVAATVIQNGFNFAIGVILIRNLRPHDYGLYSFIFTLIAVSAILINASVASQLGLSIPKYGHIALIRSTGRMFSSVTVACIILLIPVTVLALIWAGATDPLVVIAATFLVASSMYRSYGRAYFFATRETQMVLAQDILAAIAATAGAAAALLLLPPSEHLAGVLAAMGLGNFLGSLMFSPAPAPAYHLRGLRRHAKSFTRHWSRAGWTLLTISMGNLAGMAPSIAVVATHSVVSLALISAPGVLFAPIRLTFVVLQSLLRPEFASLAARRQVRRLIQLYLGSVAVAVGVSGAAGVLIMLLWPLIFRVLFAKHYVEADVILAATLTFLATIVGCVRVPGAIMLNALGSFRIQALWMSSLTPVIVLAVIVLIKLYPPVEVLWANVLLETTMLSVELVLITRRLSRF